MDASWIARKMWVLGLALYALASLCSAQPSYSGQTANLYSPNPTVLTARPVPQFYERAAVEFAAPEKASREVDLLIVGGNESAVAAALQAARMGVARIAVVSATQWLGGQFTAQSIAHIDSESLPPAGLYRELRDRLAPGRPALPIVFSPAHAEQRIQEMLAPYVNSKQLEIFTGYQASLTFLIPGSRDLTGVRFDSSGKEDLTIRARLTIDSSDWGDVIKLSRTAYFSGPDPQAAGHPIDWPKTRLHPLRWLALLEPAAPESKIAKPPHYSAATYESCAVTESHGPADDGYRRLPSGEILLNLKCLDYFPERLPDRVARALEDSGPGASGRNLIDLTPAQREIVFADMRERTLGLVYYLQNDLPRPAPVDFRRMQLSTAFRTSHRLPPLPYIAESLRLDAADFTIAYDVQDFHNARTWARRMSTDSLLAYQGVMGLRTPGLGTLPATLYSTLPLRALLPRRTNGLLGAARNVGVSSRVQPAIGSHRTQMDIGQAAGAVAAISIQERVQPRDLLTNIPLLRRVQSSIVTGRGGNTGALWPYTDLVPGSPGFAAAQMTAVSGLLPATNDGRNTFNPGEAAPGMDIAAPGAGGRTRLELAGSIWDDVQKTGQWPQPGSNFEISYLPSKDAPPKRILFYLLDDPGGQIDWYADRTSFRSALRSFQNRGCAVTIHDRRSLPHLTDRVLDGFDQVWIMELDLNEDVNYTPTDAAAVQRFYERGGGVWIAFYGEQGPAHDWTDDGTVFTKVFGVGYLKDAHTSMNNPVTSDHPLFAGVKEVHTFSRPAVLQISNPAVQSIFSVAGEPIIAVLDGTSRGKGRVIFDGAVTMFYSSYPQWENSNDEVLLHLDSVRFAENALRWLGTRPKRDGSEPR